MYAHTLVVERIRVLMGRDGTRYCGVGYPAPKSSFQVKIFHTKKYSTHERMATSQDTQAAIFAHVQRHVDFLLANSPIYAHLFRGVKVHAVTPSRVVAHLPLQPEHLNSKQSLHGSVSATLVDFMGGVAIASYDERNNTGVSTDMHVSFVSGAKAGDVLEVEGRVERCGGTLAFTSVVIRKLDEGKGEGNGDPVAKGSHTKCVKQR